MIQDTLTTKELANILKVAHATPRTVYCMKGHYLGLKPNKLPNGRLAWPLADVEKLLGRSIPMAA